MAQGLGFGFSLGFRAYVPPPRFNGFGLRTPKLSEKLPNTRKRPSFYIRLGERTFQSFGSEVQITSGFYLVEGWTTEGLGFNACGVYLWFRLPSLLSINSKT